MVNNGRAELQFEKQSLAGLALQKCQDGNILKV